MIKAVLTVYQETRLNKNTVTDENFWMVYLLTLVISTINTKHVLETKAEVVERFIVSI